MRLWHIDLVKNGLLPKSQIIAQWRELNSIFKKQDKHILINYIYNYPKEFLLLYTEMVIDELAKRHIKIKSYENYANYFKGCDLEIYTWRKENNHKFDEHNEEYLKICYWNLREKYIRGQKDFTKEIWERLDKYVKDKLGEL